MNDLVIGQIVRSTAGRDKGSWLIVTEIVDDNYVRVCNGRERKMSTPKKKKIKHLKKTNYVHPSIKERMDKGIKISNAEIRKILDVFEKEH